MPLTAGGGIRSIEDVTTLLRSGDKVVVTTAAVTHPKLLKEIVKRLEVKAL